MGVCVYPVLEKELEGVEYQTDGKMLAKIIDVADKRAESLGVGPLMSFFGFDPEVLIEDFGLETDEPLTQKWFDAEDGLEAVETLIKDMKENPDAYALISDTGRLVGTNRIVRETNEKVLAGAVEDLKEMQKVLEAASSNQLKWYLAIDF